MIVNESVIKELGKRYFNGQMPKEFRTYFRRMMLLDECLTETLCNFKSCQHDIDENKYLRDFISWKSLDEEYHYFHEHASLSSVEPLSEPPRYILQRSSDVSDSSGSLEEAGVQGQSPA